MPQTHDGLSARFYPEKRAGGYTSVDGTVEFYGRINALLDSSMDVLDFGAGRAAWYDPGDTSYRARLRMIRGKVARVVACDVDDAVLDNATANEIIVLLPGDLPFDDEEFDLIIADYVLEHLDDPISTAAELDRVLKPGGWICARTPNRYGYVSVATHLIPNRRHVSVLKKAQPDREEVDVFPTRFRLNTPGRVETAFPTSRFEHCTYYYEPEPGYSFNKPTVFRAMMIVNGLLPRKLRSSLFVFLRKK